MPTPDLAGQVDANLTRKDIEAEMARNHQALFDEIAAVDAQVANLARNDPVIAGDFSAQVNARAKAPAANPRDPKDPLIAADVVTYRGTLAPIEVPTGLKAIGIGAFVFGIVWVFLGIAGWAMSAYCALSESRSGTTSQKLGGFLLALFFGPFYWFYKLGSSTYCKKLKVTPLPQ